MIASPDHFFITGGTLPTDASSYVVRQADEELLAALQRGEFCYVLNTRQMGKSSLMVRTAARLKQEGVQVAVLDLTAVGQNLTPEQWYGGLLVRLSSQIGLEAELMDYWLAHSELGPMQRFFAAIGQVALPAAGRLVIFVDEIDAVQSLPFSADEFFGGIRECYNRRTLEPQFSGLTLCLLGVATPVDLIADTRMSPFNIGHRIELRDFTYEEAHPLAAGLDAGVPREGSETASSSQGEALLRRVLFWTGGHPYLTQRLCRAVAESSDGRALADVDRLCEQMFLSKAARDTDDNLAFVRSRLLQSDTDLASLLDLYAQVRAGKRVLDDETNPLCSILRLSGVVRVVDRCLLVRNRIYDRVFDREWVQAHMPGAELRRQRVAYRRGLIRAAGLAGIAVMVVGILALLAVSNARRANRNQQIAQAAMAQASTEADQAYHLLYDADSSLAQQSYEAGNIPSVLDQLDQMRPQSGKKDLRGFEWYYLQGLCHQDLRTLRGAQETLSSLAFSPDGRLLASAESDSFVRIWDPATGRELHRLSRAGGAAQRVTFSPDGRLLAVGDSSGGIRIWDVATWRPIRALHGHAKDVMAVAFSPDGKILASGALDKTVRLWNVATGRQLRVMPADTSRGVWSVAFSPDGKSLAAGCDDKHVRLFDVATGHLKQTLLGHTWYVYSVAFSPDGKLLASAGGDATIVLWDPKTGQLLRTLRGHTSYIYGLAFSPDSKRLASASWDDTVRVWDTVTGQPTRILRGHTSYVTCVAFSPDDRTLASAGYDRTIKLWDTTQETGGRLVSGPGESARSVYLSPQGSLFVVDSSGMLWNGLAGRPLFRLPASESQAQVFACSRDGRLLATIRADQHQSGAVWDAATGRRLYSLGDYVAGYGEMPVPGVSAGVRFNPIAFSPDSARILVTYYRDHPPTLEDAITGRQVFTFPQSFGQAVFSSDGRRLVSVGPSVDTVSVWDVASFRILYSLPTGDLQPMYAAFSPDGSRIVVIGEVLNKRPIIALNAELIAAAAGSRPILLKGHTDVIRSIGFSPDGRRIITGSWDNTIKLWDTATGRETLTLRADIGRVSQAAFTPDGKHILAVGEHNMVKEWNAASDLQIAAWDAARQSEPASN